MVECSSVSQVIFLFILFPVIVANLRRLVYEALKTIRHASVFNSHVPFETAARLSSYGRRLEVGTQGNVPRSELGPEGGGGAVCALGTRYTGFHSRRGLKR